MEDKKTTLSSVSKLLRSDADAQRKLHRRLQNYVRQKEPKLIPSSLVIEIAKALGTNASDVYLELTEDEQAELSAAGATAPPTPGLLKDRWKEHAKIRTARGKKLRLALETSGLKQRQLLEKIAAGGGPTYNATTVAGYFAGKSLAPDEFVRHVARVLELDAKNLLGGNSPLAVSRASRSKKAPVENAAVSAIGISVSAPSIGLSAEDTVAISKGTLVGNLSEIVSDGKDGYVLCLRIPIPHSALHHLLRMFMSSS